jgi:hypothetical protein
MTKIIAVTTSERQLAIKSRRWFIVEDLYFELVAN